MAKPKPVYPDRPAGMEATSFRRYGIEEAKVFPRMITAVRGIEGTGKTNFGLSAPRMKQPGTQEGMFLFHTDLGLEGVGHKFVDAFPGPIYKADYILDVQTLKDQEEDQIKKAAAPIAKRFWADLELAIKRNVRSLVFDNASELMEIDRYAEWGKLSMKPHHHTPINARWKRLYKMVSMGKSNVVMLQRMTDEYGADDKPTGNMKPQGYSKIAFESQEVLTAWRDSAHVFHMTIEKSRHDHELVGMDLDGEECTFAGLASRVFPDVDPDFWE